MSFNKIELRKQLRDLGIKVVQGNYIRKKDITAILDKSTAASANSDSISVSDDDGIIRQISGVNIKNIDGWFVAKKGSSFFVSKIKTAPYMEVFSKHPLAKKYEANITVSKVVPKSGTPEYHQHKIAVDTVKNPAKGLLSGPTAEESEKLLLTKFKYTKQEIEQLKK